jgi:hypothetical protein
MSESRLTRWSPASGFAFVVLFLVGSVITIAVPGSDEADSAIVSY